MRRRPERDRRAWLGSALVHGTFVAVAWLTTAVQPHPLEYVTYDIQLVEAPPQELVVETPDPTPPPVQEEPEPEPEPEPDPIQEEPEPEPEPETPEEEPEPEPTPPKPEPQPEESRPRPADVTATMEGLRKDYPAYYQDIVTQIMRCFQARWTKGGDWEATIDFWIDADGSIPGRDIDISRSSGNLDFDLRALEAVECAGTKLDPLPDDLPVERLPVRFNFSPGGDDLADGPTQERHPT